MEEKKAIQLLLIIAAAGIVIEIVSISVFASIVPDILLKFGLPMACMEENSTYFLAAPTSPDLCKRINRISQNMDADSFEESCNILDEKNKEVCVAISEFYGKRINDCEQYIYGIDLGNLGETIKPKESSVSNSDVARECVKLG